MGFKIYNFSLTLTIDSDEEVSQKIRIELLKVMLRQIDFLNSQTD